MLRSMKTVIVAIGMKPPAHLTKVMVAHVVADVRDIGLLLMSRHKELMCLCPGTQPIVMVHV